MKRNDDRSATRDSRAYEVIPVVITNKDNKKKTQSSEYKSLDRSKLTSHNHQYASLSVATSVSRTSLTSISSGNDVVNSTKRHAIIIPSLSEDRCTKLLETQEGSKKIAEHAQSLMTGGSDEIRGKKMVYQQTSKIPGKERNERYKENEQTVLKSDCNKTTESNKQRNKKRPKYENVVFEAKSKTDVLPRQLNN